MATGPPAGKWQETDGKGTAAQADGAAMGKPAYAILVMIPSGPKGCFPPAACRFVRLFHPFASQGAIPDHSAIASCQRGGSISVIGEV